MEIRTYRASDMREALSLVRRELGSEAVILHTREVPRRGLWNRLRRSRRSQIEVTAGIGVNVRFRAAAPAATDAPAASVVHSAAEPRAAASDIAVRPHLEALQKMVRELYDHARRERQSDLPEELFQLYTSLIEADVAEDLARELVCRLRESAEPEALADLETAKARVCQLVENELTISGPIRPQPGQRKVVALVGPTGVGKTTTIAKLAANFRLRDSVKLGLITVDTYRIAAVEQLRTYADIIDLPMKVVMNPRDMPRALEEFEGLELVLVDTAGRSPRDELKIQELKAFLAAAGVHEVHLVLSAVASPRSLLATAERFASVGTTSLILTKLDEAASMGGLLNVVRGVGLPLSYVTTGQDVPDDIEAAEVARLARLILGQENVAAS